jgi:uncharacterized membrane protein YeaQ/YmgE (transglycosylase-associated protein family)
MDSGIGVLIWVIVGLVSGGMARLIMKGEGDLLVDLMVGVVGALAGGFILGRLLGVLSSTSGFNAVTIVTSFAGAALAIGVVRVLSDQRATI